MFEFQPCMLYKYIGTADEKHVVHLYIKQLFAEQLRVWPVSIYRIQFVAILFMCDYEIPHSSPFLEAFAECWYNTCTVNNNFTFQWYIFRSVCWYTGIRIWLNTPSSSVLSYRRLTMFRVIFTLKSAALHSYRSRCFRSFQVRRLPLIRLSSIVPCIIKWII